MTGSKKDRSASVRAAHQSTSASSVGVHAAPAPAPASAGPPRGSRACQAWRTASAHRQASTIVASRNGPAATLWLLIAGASDVQAVGWLMTGESGWLVTDM